MNISHHRPVTVQRVPQDRVSQSSLSSPSDCRCVVAFLTLCFLLTPLIRAGRSGITLRLLDAKSAKPLRKVPVTMFAWNGSSTFRPDNIPKGEVVVHDTTDAEGKIVFSMPQPLTEHIAFSVGTPDDFAGCWNFNDLSPVAIQQSGVVATYNESKCGKSKVQVIAKPGEVVIIDRKLTAWEKIHRELP